MRVWIDQPACVGNGVCVEICPEVFVLDDGDVAFVRGADGRLLEGRAGTLTVPRSAESAVIEAADECPTACIYVEDD